MSDTLIELSFVDGLCVIHVGNEIDIANAEVFARYLDEAAAGAEKLVVSFERCRYIDSTGLRPLLRLAARLGDEFFAVVPRGSQLRRIVDLIGLGARMQTFDSLDDALGAAGRRKAAV